MRVTSKSSIHRYFFALLIAASLLLGLSPSAFAAHNPAHEIRSGEFENEEAPSSQDNTTQDAPSTGSSADGAAGNEGSLLDNDCESDEIELSVAIVDDNGNETFCIKKDGSGSENPIYIYVRALLRFLAGILTLIVVMTMVIGGVQYAASSGNPDTVKKAKSRIFNAIIALLLYLFMTTILNFVIPGGVF